MKSITSWILPVAGIIALLAASAIFVQTASLRPTAQAQTASAVVDDASRYITVVGEGTVKIKPDIAQANIGVSVKDVSVKAASSQAKQLMDAVLSALKGQGVAEEDIQTSGFSIWSEEQPPVLENASQPQVAYRVNNQVAVTVRDLDKVGAILDAAIEAGANAINGVSFAIADPSQVESDARQKAVADARAKAEELAGLHGATIGDLISVSEVVGSGGGYYAGGFESALMRGLGGGGGGPVSPGELELSLRLQVVYALE